ncbi:MAG: hypothetical protein FWF63_03470 [Fibromonadales bacterium]|nr:hypothetical protein [Fibromonadales bacterium]
MKKLFFILAVAFLLSCTSIERDSVCDEKSIYYNGCVGGVSSSSVPSSSSGSTQSITYGDPVPYMGETYETVVIGKQTWMARNMSYGADGSRCYLNDAAYCQTYGRLYKWETAMSVCPPGWSLPSTYDWNVLINYIGTTSTAGLYLKAQSGWGDGDGNGKDVAGFSALPGGFGGYDNLFSDVGIYGYWWGNMDNNYGSAYVWSMGFSNEAVSNNQMSKDNLYSVRCVKD